MSANYKTFLINLDKSVDRLERSASILKEHNILFERVSAVYGADLSAQELSTAYDYQLPNAYYKKLNVGEIGCYLSHRKVWQKIVDEQLDFAVILEDDFNIVGDFNQMLSTVSRLDITWHYIKLAGHNRTRKALYQADIENFELVVYDKVPARTCAQVVSLSGAKQLLKTSRPFKRPIDIDLQYWWEKDVRVLGLLPYVVEPNDTAVSEIDKLARRNKAEKSHTRKLADKVRFTVRNNLANTNLIKQLKGELIK